MAEPVYFPARPGVARVVHLTSVNGLRELSSWRPTLMEVVRGRASGATAGIPAGVAYREGHLLVCDTELNVVHDWDLSSGRSRQIGRAGEVELGKPVAVAVDDRGGVYVADALLGSVMAFDLVGRLVRRIRPADREDYKPVAVAVYGQRVYAADIAGHRVDVFSIDDGAHLGTLGEIGADRGQFYYPTGLATDASGRIYVSDMMNARVQVFDADHNLIITMGGPGDRHGDLGKPKHLAVGPDGTVFIADAAFAHVHAFNGEGQLLLLFGGPGDEAGATPLPFGVAVASSLPEVLSGLVPAGFDAQYFLFVTNTIGSRRISLYAVGRSRPAKGGSGVSRQLSARAGEGECTTLGGD